MWQPKNRGCVVDRASNLQEWHERATPEQRSRLVAILGGATLRVGLYQLRADPSKSYARAASAARAAAIEGAVAQMRRDDDTVPLITRGDICPACNGCQYWRAVHG
jgi:hypothetical protein